MSVHSKEVDGMRLAALRTLRKGDTGKKEKAETHESDDTHLVHERRQTAAFGMRNHEKLGS